MITRIVIIMLLISLFVCGCSDKHSPVQVSGELEIGHYMISPPKGYWYFPRKYLGKFKASNDIFLITFWKDKEAATRKDPDKMGAFFNFGVSENKFNNFDNYYNNASDSGIKYNNLPSETSILNTIDNWSCKQSDQGVYGIECISLRDNLITIGVYGNDKGLVFSKIPLLQKVLESFKIE